MSDLVDGRRYRVSAEGTYRADLRGFFDASGYQITRAVDVESGGVTAELLPEPLPLTPGSAVRAGGRAYLRVNGGEWAAPGGAWVNDAYVQAFGDVTVLFDAGVEA